MRRMRPLEPGLRLLAFAVVGFGFITACAMRGEPLPPTAFAEVEVSSEREAVPSHEPIHFTLSLHNRGSDSLLLRFPTSQRYDLQIVDESGTSRWRWSDGRSFAQVLEEEQLDPGETRVWRVTFEGVLSPGRYTVEGMVVAREGPLRSESEFTVH